VNERHEFLETACTVSVTQDRAQITDVGWNDTGTASDQRQHFIDNAFLNDTTTTPFTGQTHQSYLSI